MKKKGIKITTIVLAFLLIFLMSVSAFAAEDTVITKEFSASGDSFGNSNEVQLFLKDGVTRPKFDYRWLTAGCTTAYNQQLAVIANMLCTDAYNESYVTDGDEKDKENCTILIRALNFDDTKRVVLKADDYSVDKDDLTSAVLGHKVITVDGKKYNVFAAVISGSQTGNGDWLSNFDVGYDDESYYEIKNVGHDHPDWVNKNRHKGFDVAATRIKKVIDAYIQENSVEGAANTILVTGHSRGAAIANILGTYYEDSKDIQSYTYTFAPPACTTEDESITNKYKTIFNTINNDDFTSIMPLPEWGFRRYGQNIVMTVSKDDEIKNTADKYMENGYIADLDKIKDLKNQILKVADSRASLYVTHTISDDYYETDKDSENNTWFDKCKKELEEAEQLAPEENLFSYTAPGKDIGEEGHKLLGTISKTFKTAFVTKGLAVVMGERSMNSIVGYSNYFVNLGTLEQIKNRETVPLPAYGILGRILPMGVDGSLPKPHYTASSYSMTLFAEDKACEHTGGVATATSGKICERCGSEYGLPDNPLTKDENSILPYVVIMLAAVATMVVIIVKKKKGKLIKKEIES